MTKRLTRRTGVLIGMVAAVLGGLLTAGMTTTAGAEPVRVAEFAAECQFSHRLPDDPIVLPNLPGASHSHDFFGNRSTDARSNYQSLLGATGNCDPLIDLSSYWVPTLTNRGVAVPPSSMTFYYLAEINNPAAIKSIPVGLKIVAGNAKATGDADSIARWSCLHHGEVNPSKNFVNCPAGSKLETYLDFPQCWNGRDLDSSDHKSHMAYPVGGNCTPTHPVALPKLRFVLRYSTNGDPSQMKLASGPGYTMHGDFFNVWPTGEMDRRVRDCINAVIKCGPNGIPG
jgi:hypothetical protein